MPANNIIEVLIIPIICICIDPQSLFPSMLFASIEV